MGIDLSSLSPVLTGLAGGAVATALARWGARGVTDKRGWKCIRPSALHWTGVILGTALTSLFVYVWLFVGSSRADGVQQMQILGWMIVAFTLAIMMCAAQIWLLLRQDVQWRGSIITFKRGGVRVQDDLKTLVDCRQRWTLSRRTDRVTRMVSSRSGLVDTSATGVSISSCTRWMYLIACAGRSAQLNARRRWCLQPSISS
jgi:hypothetical protein